MLTYDTWNGEMPFFSIDNETKGALDVIRWAYEHYGEEVVYACSFGIEGIVLIDLISKVKPDATVVFLDTGLHFRETYETIEKVQKKYPSLRIVMKKPRLSLEEQAEQMGEQLWVHEPNRCCEIRKIIPLREVLTGVPAWISGLRREQSSTRRHVEFLNKDPKFQSIKICPLIHWTWKDVWNYVYKHQLPYNELHDKGYPSIGCEPCTSPALDANDLRSGRWAGRGKVECGLHES
ncbi:adenylylsulfate reductase, thioredoxin dependent family protein [Anoxybacillus sp. B7M1]|uniref:phosphoadenylyl-sulfate reductase n=1 Tax=unclassified Anoxybacillus TaxID=2639704 RepID=UPI0005CCCEE1|nr:MULTISPECIES: phosphoadenylyl-sulfate reductase [unclassified Anoxybacillus]ANB58279.1 adenylylsulfate reductase, thioredoxin dependent family protein [Anoxybacillus sp. B2M1]ANB65496.1 adenylylsulfate reductase, thioredoxin dependent family protein [Anoxybacillus sp. B7M1]